MVLFIKENRIYMLKKIVTLIYFIFNLFLCGFILISINFVIISPETLKINFNKIVLSKILYSLFVTIISTLISYLFYLIVKKFIIINFSTKKMLTILFAIFFVMSILSFLIFIFSIR